MILRRPIFYGADAACVIAYHTADGRGCPGIRREKKAMAAQHFVQILVITTRFHIDLEIFRVDGKYFLHLVKIDDDALVYGNGISFQARSCSPARYRDFPLKSIVGNSADLVGTVGPNNGIGKSMRVIRLVVGVEVEHRFPCKRTARRL